MAILTSNISPKSDDFRQRHAAYQQLADDLLRYRAESLGMSGDRSESQVRALNTLRSKGKLTVQERIEALIDPGAPILPVAPFAGLGLYEGVPAGAGLITCISRVSGMWVMIVANNPLVKGGTYFPMTVRKHIRAQEIASEARLPCIYLVDSGGAFLPLQAEVFPDRYHFGRIFYNQARLSRAGIGQIAVVLGSCTAGGAYVPAMSDETIMVQGNGTIFLGGPPLVKAATGEEISAEELGGAAVHCEKSGVADHFCETELEALSRARSIVASLGQAQPSWFRRYQPNTPSAPQYDPKELYGIVGADLKKSFSMREVLARLLDGSRLDEFKTRYGTSLICGFAEVHGYQVGVIANDGILFSESALKGAHFVELCNQRAIPLLFIHNIVGFMVGKAYEHEGIAKHGAKLVNAVASARVPKFSLLAGGSFGAGNYAMCGRAYEPRFLWTWPNSRISVMGGAQAAHVMTEVKFSGKSNTSETDIGTYKNMIIDQYEREGSPWFSTAHLWDDGVFDPTETRDILGIALAISGYDEREPTNFGVFRM